VDNDVDGDGHRNDVDCDDDDATIHPEADELCDGIDNDCDELVDETGAVDGTLWYWDADGDGYGNPDNSQQTCDEPLGYVDNADDCDDYDNSVNPESVWSIDADGDGYGDDSTAVTDCEQPSGTVAAGGDCDDDDDSLSPDTRWYPDGDGDGYGEADGDFVEQCEAPDDHVRDDTDCDDTDAELNPETTWPVDDDNDDFGHDTEVLVGCEMPEGATDNALDCDDDEGEVYPGAEEVCLDGLVNDCDSDEATAQEACAWDSPVTLRDAEIELEMSANERYARAVDAAGDFDGDGWADVVVGAMWASTGSASMNGAVFVFLGPLEAGDQALTDADITFEGPSNQAMLGASVAGVGDTDGDGFDDLLMGAPGAVPGADEGAAWLIHGPTTTLDAASLTLGSLPYLELGTAVAAAGDLDGDGVGDLLAAGATGNSGTGIAYLVSGALTGSQRISDVAMASFAGLASNENFGTQRSLAAAGDVDGDGIDDVVLGSPELTDADAAYLFTGPLTGDHALSDATCTWGSSLHTRMGQAVAGAGDLDGDGYDDVLVGAPTTQSSSSKEGAVHVFAGGSTLPTEGEARATLYGVDSGDQIGGDVDVLDDVTDDGIPDLLVGSGYGSATVDTITSSTGSGEVYIFAGPLTGTSTTDDATVVISQNSSYSGMFVANVGDVDATGEVDIAVVDSSTSSSSPGSVYLLFTPGP